MAKNQKKVVGGPAELIVSEEMLRGKIYTIRGQKVMLDYDLAEIYGYTTGAFNQQVARNRDKFDEDFMFQLSRYEVDLHLISQNVISSLEENEEIRNLKSQNMTSSWGGMRKLPYAFTEQGIYMLMTVLRGELAVKQSKALIRTFKRMKDYIIENNERLEYRSNLELALKVSNNVEEIVKMRSELNLLDREVKDVTQKMSGAVMKSELSHVVLDFMKFNEPREIVIMDGEFLKGSEAYVDIYSKAKQSIYVIDNYVGIKTLRHLENARKGIEIVVFSDNLGKYLHMQDYEDFRREREDLTIRFVRTEGRVHDRLIVVDYGSKNEVVYHAGGSEKDAGKRMTVICKYYEGEMVETVREVVKKMLNNRELALK